MAKAIPTNQRTGMALQGPDGHNSLVRNGVNNTADFLGAFTDSWTKGREEGFKAGAGSLRDATASGARKLAAPVIAVSAGFIASAALTRWWDPDISNAKVDGSPELEKEIRAGENAAAKATVATGFWVAGQVVGAALLFGEGAYYDIVEGCQRLTGGDPWASQPGELPTTVQQAQNLGGLGEQDGLAQPQPPAGGVVTAVDHMPDGQFDDQ